AYASNFHPRGLEIVQMRRKYGHWNNGEESSYTDFCEYVEAINVPADQFMHRPVFSLEFISPLVLNNVIHANAAQPPVSPPNNHCYSHMAGLPPIHFCAYITDANRQRRRQRLASEFSNRIDSLVATLQVQTGDTWEVRLHRDISGRLWFTEGWTNFFDFYSVANGYLLVFQYIRNSTLNAAIFSSNSSEIAYPIRGVVNEQAEDHSDLDSE
ncbi:B3 domain-containing transcription factor VRN1, partial [Linum perenne]